MLIRKFDSDKLEFRKLSDKKMLVIGSKASKDDQDPKATLGPDKLFVLSFSTEHDQLTSEIIPRPPTVTVEQVAKALAESDDDVDEDGEVANRGYWLEKAKIAMKTICGEK